MLSFTATVEPKLSQVKMGEVPNYYPHRIVFAGIFLTSLAFELREKAVSAKVLSISP